MVNKGNIRLVLHQFGFQAVDRQVAVRINHHVVVLPQPGRSIVDDLPFVRVQCFVGQFAGINPRHFGQDAVHQGFGGFFQGQVVDPVFFGQPRCKVERKIRFTAAGPPGYNAHALASKNAEAVQLGPAQL